MISTLILCAIVAAQNFDLQFGLNDTLNWQNPLTANIKGSNQREYLISNETIAFDLIKNPNQTLASILTTLQKRDSVVSDLCSASLAVSGLCGPKITVPDSFSVKMCSVEVPTIDECLTMAKTEIPCGVTCERDAACHPKMCLEEQCVPGVDSCASMASTDYPCGVKCKGLKCSTKTCTAKTCVPGTVACKSKIKLDVPCGTECHGPQGCKTKFCEASTCVPGTRMVKQDVPCGVNIKTKDISLCDVAKDSNLVEAIEDTKKLCKCVDKLAKFAEDQFEAALSNGESSSDQVYVSAFKAAADLTVCFGDKILNPTNNKDQVFKQITEKYEVVKWGPEIGTSEYLQFIVHSVACVVGMAILY
jgi:hypothetical protein